MNEDESFRRVSSKSYTFEVPLSTDERKPSFGGRGGSFRESGVGLGGEYSEGTGIAGPLRRAGSHRAPAANDQMYLTIPDNDLRQHRQELEALYRSPPVLQAFENVCFIAELLKKQDKDDRVSGGSV